MWRTLQRAASPLMGTLSVTLRLRADKIPGLIRTPTSPILRHLRIRTQRPRLFSIARGRNDARGGFPLLAPMLQLSDHIKPIRPLASAAMSHARHHKKTIRIANFARATRRFDHALVIVNAVERRNLPIAPTVILDQLPAVAEEWLQVRIHRIDQAAVGFFSERPVAIEIQRPEIPLWILEDHILKKIVADPKRSRARDHFPSKFAARL